MKTHNCKSTTISRVWCNPHKRLQTRSADAKEQEFYLEVAVTCKIVDTRVYQAAKKLI